MLNAVEPLFFCGSNKCDADKKRELSTDHKNCDVDNNRQLKNRYDFIRCKQAGNYNTLSLGGEKKSRDTAEIDTAKQPFIAVAKFVSACSSHPATSRCTAS